MKRIFCCVALLLLLGTFASCKITNKTPLFRLNKQTLYLTYAYSEGGEITNDYTANDTKLRFRQAPKEEAYSFDQAFQLYDMLTKQAGKDYVLLSKKDNRTLAFAVKIGIFYSYVLFSWDPDGFMRSITYNIPIKGTFAQTHQVWAPALSQITFPKMYPIRPGEKKQDDSPELTEIKELIGKSYSPTMQTSKQKNITTVSMVDSNQQRIFALIRDGKASDATVWLEKNLANYSPIYLFAFAQRMALQHKPIKDYMFWILAASLRARADAALCKDKYVGQYVTGLLLDSGGIAAPVYSQTEKDALNQKDLHQKVIQWDKKHPQKNHPDWMCKSGHGVWTDETFPEKEWATRRKSFKEQYAKSATK